jgi:restriction system protein
MVAVDYRQLMQPALDRLERAGGELGFDELLQEVASALNLDEDAARSPLASGRETHLANNLRWALSYLAADGKLQVAGNGSLVRSAGSSGFRETPAAFGEPLHPTSLNGKPAEFAVCAHPVDDGGDECDELGQLVGKAHRQLKWSLLGHIHAREPAFFEELIIDLLLAMGYGTNRSGLSRRLGGRGDGGVDGVIYQDELGLDFFYVQAKRYKPSSTVPLAEVRDFAGSLEAHKAPKGVFVTTAFLPASAHKFVEAIPRRITLIDGNGLAELMIRHNVGVKAEPVHVLKEIDPVFFAATANG